MARSKNYSEEEVIEKAMSLFWRNGYETTSMQMLEKEMGINKFSIYSSFGSKNGLFLESIKCYKKKLSVITTVLQSSNNGIQGIKEYFYAFLEFSKENESCKGCLVTNTSNELGKDADPEILMQLQHFIVEIKELFVNNLGQEAGLDRSKIEEYADYLIISLYGLGSASRVFRKDQLSVFIENIFKIL
ncbi:TetR/AcrR family transcriptional regulator [Algoriphagus winogradskyi]|nr:TetR/AcrR family transcriptional regulator [Algoriphagus winogradskyi]